MSQEIMQVTSLPGPMLNALQEEGYLVHDHAHITDPAALTKVTALVGMGGSAKVDRNLLSMLPNVKVIVIHGVGYDGVDVAAAKERGIVVTHTPDVLNDDVADLALALMLSIGRKIPQADRFVRNGDWASEPFPMTRKVSGARLGIVGLGRIGQAIAKRAQGFDMNIAYSGRQAKVGVPYAFYPNVTELAKVVDFLVLTVPGGKETKNLVNAEVLQALGAKGFLINVARGPVVDEPALIHALKTKSIAGAACDVFWDEPSISPELRALQNTVLTPHIGCHTLETRRAMAELAMRNLNAFFKGEPLPTPVPECMT